MDSFTPNPVDTKNTTFKKAQKRVAKIGVEQVKKQNQAMWSALTGTAKKKCLLAISHITCRSFPRGTAAIGHFTTFFDPGTNAAKCDDAEITRLKRRKTHQ